MLRSDYWMSMRPICSYLLFKHVDYIIVACLTKCLSWLVGVESHPCSSKCRCIIILFLSFSFESIIDFLPVTLALGLKKWLKSQRRVHNTRKKSPHMHAYRYCGRTWSLMDVCLSISRECPGVYMSKTSLSLMGWLPKWLGWLLRDLLLMWKVYVVCSIGSTSLTKT